VVELVEQDEDKKEEELEEKEEDEEEEGYDNTASTTVVAARVKLPKAPREIIVPKVNKIGPAAGKKNLVDATGVGVASGLISLSSSFQTSPAVVADAAGDAAPPPFALPTAAPPARNAAKAKEGMYDSLISSGHMYPTT